MTDPIIVKAIDAKEKLVGYYAARRGEAFDATKSEAWKIGWREGGGDVHSKFKTEELRASRKA